MTVCSTVRIERQPLSAAQPKLIPSSVQHIRVPVYAKEDRRKKYCQQDEITASRPHMPMA
jgi:hypothetical protein